MILTLLLWILVICLPTFWGEKKKIRHGTVPQLHHEMLWHQLDGWLPCLKPAFRKGNCEEKNIYEGLRARGASERLLWWCSGRRAGRAECWFLWATGRQMGCGVARAVMSVVRCVDELANGPLCYTQSWKSLQNLRPLNPLYRPIQNARPGLHSLSADFTGCSSYADECV